MSLLAQNSVQSGGTEQLTSRRHVHRLRSDKQAQPSDGVERISAMPLRSLRNHLFKQRHVEVLVIKQIDGELVHVCGAGVLEGAGSVSHKRRELMHDNHAFPVRMHDGNQVLEPHDFKR